jgi:signal transduction histidine kinase
MSVALPTNRDVFSVLSGKTNRRSLTVIPAAPIPTAETGVLAADFLAHDTRNWLTVLRVYCDLLKSSGAVQSGYEPWMEELSSAVDRGQTLVTSLLDSVERNSAEGHPSAQPANGLRNGEKLDTLPTVPLARCRMKVAAVSAATDEPASLNVAEALQRWLPLYQRLAGVGIQVKLDASFNSGSIAMPESALERILQNLMMNAIESMPDGGELRIVLRRANRAAGSKRATGKNLLLRVCDTGTGIAPERLHHIFERGFSGKRPRAGNAQRGLGLAIVRELIERAGGSIQVRSQPGRGSCFEVKLPRI